MANALGVYERRVTALVNSGGAPSASLPLIDEGLRQALAEYSRAVPLTMETVVVLPGDGREIALDTLSGLVDVTDVWWPFDSTAATEIWPPNRVAGFRLWWDDARPVLFLTAKDQSQPQLNDEVRIWYTKLHTISGLDAAAVTTIPDEHESVLVRGAAGYVLLSMPVAGDVRESPGARWHNRFVDELRRLASRSAHVRGEPFGEGWKLDKWSE